MHSQVPNIRQEIGLITQCFRENNTKLIRNNNIYFNCFLILLG